MKKIALTAAALLVAAPAFAGNVEVFVAPEPVEVAPAPEPMGSNLGFIVPLVAVAVIAGAIALSQVGDDDDDEED